MFLISPLAACTVTYSKLTSSARAAISSSEGWLSRGTAVDERLDAIGHGCAHSSSSAAPFSGREHKKTRTQFTRRARARTRRRADYSDHETRADVRQSPVRTLINSPK